MLFGCHIFVIKLWEKRNSMKKNSFTQKSLRKNVFSMLLTWFPLLGACFWILCRNHNFCCVSTVILTKPCFWCCWKQISLEKSDSGSFQCCWKQISLEKSDSGSIGNKAWIKYKYKSQNSDKCAALTNHLSLLIKRNLQFFDILSSPIPGINPGLSGGSQVC